jgi:hypothetical protein
MVVKEPEYRMFYMGQWMTLTGRDQVSAFYRDFDASGGTVFGPLEERVAVADWGLALESDFGHHLRGYQLEAMRVEVPDSGGYYQFEHWLSSFWPYDENCLLIGEHAGSRVLHEIDERDFVTPARAAELLAPLIDGQDARSVRASDSKIFPERTVAFHPRSARRRDRGVRGVIVRMSLRAGPAQRRWPPVPPADQHDSGRDEEGADDEGVEQDADRQPEADHAKLPARRAAAADDGEDPEGAGEDEARRAHGGPGRPGRLDDGLAQGGVQASSRILVVTRML